MFKDVELYIFQLFNYIYLEASCYSSENENKLVEIRDLYHEKLHFSIKGGAY